MFRRLATMDLHTLLRHLRSDQSDQSIAQQLPLNRKTVAKYRQWAEGQGLLTGELPDLASLHRLVAQTWPTTLPAQNRSRLEPYRAEIEAGLARQLSPKLIHQQLSQRPDFKGSLAAMYRFCQHLRPASAPSVVTRLETAPGEVAQVDFGEIGQLTDPITHQKRKAFVFVMVLGWSRHMFAELVFDQKLPTWLLCHQHAFEFFNGVPKRVIIDNLKAAIIRAYAHEHEVEVQRAYGECAEHYGFLIDPCLPAHPQHKGKVERGGIGYLKQSFVPLLSAETPLTDANAQLRSWLRDLAGQREHGTTHARPLERFTQTEQAALQALPTNAYAPAIWKQAKLQRDGYVVFEKSFYSAPTRYVGQHLWLCVGLREMRLFSEQYELIATHSRATEPGQRLTHPEHLPLDKRLGLARSREHCQQQAEAIGVSTAQVVAELLAARPVDKLRTAYRVLQLREQFSAAQVEAACARALAFGDTRLVTLKHILMQGLTTATPESATLAALRLYAPRTPATFVFARPASELTAALMGGESWN